MGGTTTASNDRRANITDATQRWLWGASAGVCEYSWGGANCLERLMDVAPGGALVFVGQTAHVVPIGGTGPRSGHPPLGGDLDAPENLMLMCYRHHRFVDKDPTTFTVTVLAEMKRRWEEFVDPLQRLSAVAQTAALDYDRIRDFVATRFRLVTRDWENFLFNVGGGHGRPIWLTEARIEARDAALEVEVRWVRPSTVPTFAGHEDRPFETALLTISEAMRRVDYVFGEGVGTQKPPGWERYDWTTADPRDLPAQATMTLENYLPWLDRLSGTVEQLKAARDGLVMEVVRRDPTLLNVWPLSA